MTASNNTPNNRIESICEEIVDGSGFIQSHQFINIEKLIEQKYGYRIAPMVGLKEKYNIDGFVSVKDKIIRVDVEQYYAKNQFRFRFTVAHELGHVVLHKNILEHLQSPNPSEYVQKWEKLNVAIEIGAENEANMFAGCILVPKTRFINEIDKAIVKLKSTGLINTKTVKLPVVYEYLLQSLSETFVVSTHVLDRRFKFGRFTIPW